MLSSEVEEIDGAALNEERPRVRLCAAGVADELVREVSSLAHSPLPNELSAEREKRMSEVVDIGWPVLRSAEVA